MKKIEFLGMPLDVEIFSSSLLLQETRSKTPLCIKASRLVHGQTLQLTVQNKRPLQIAYPSNISLPWAKAETTHYSNTLSWPEKRPEHRLNTWRTRPYTCLDMTSGTSEATKNGHDAENASHTAHEMIPLSAVLLVFPVIGSNGRRIALCTYKRHEEMNAEFSWTEPRLEIQCPAQGCRERDRGQP